MKILRNRHSKSSSENSNVSVHTFFSMQYRIIKELFNEYKLRTIGIVLISVILTVASYVSLKFLESMTNGATIFLSGPNDDYFVQLINIATTFLAIQFVLLILSNLNNIIIKKYNNDISASVDKKLAKKLSDIPYDYYESYFFYEKINLAQQASSQYPNAVFGLIQLFTIISSLIMYCYILSQTNLWFILLVSLAIIVCVISSVKITERQMDFWRDRVSPETRKNMYFKAIYGNRVHHNTIQTNRCFSFFGRKYGEFNRKERTNYVKLNIFSLYTDLFISLLFIITFFITLVYIAKQVANGITTIGYFTMTMSMLFNLYSSIKRFAQFMLNQNWYIRVLSAYYEVMRFPDTETKTSNQPCNNGELKIDNLFYKYPHAENYALKGINEKYTVGEKVAIVGKNGGGKTTYISVILDLLKSHEGEISRKNIVSSAILQDFCQYQMSVKENIEIGCGGKQLPEEKINEILRKIELYDFIKDKPDGIYTKLGQLESGVELSKGQWQRLAIGRLLANEEANIWILDEPTAYLDPIAEIEMYKFIFDMAEDKLVFFVSHRLGFAQNADRIIVVDAGIIVEEGTHDELMKKRGIYWEMFESQRKWYE